MNVFMIVILLLAFGFPFVLECPFSDVADVRIYASSWITQFAAGGIIYRTYCVQAAVNLALSRVLRHETLLNTPGYKRNSASKTNWGTTIKECILCQTNPI